MAYTDRAAEAIGGPRGGTTWFDCGDSFTLQNHASVTATTTNNLLPMQTVTRPNTFFLKGAYGTGPSTIETYYDVLNTTDNWIQSIYGFQLTLATSLAASTVLRLTMSVYGSVGTLAANLVAPTAVTTITLASGLTRPLPNGTVLTLTATDGTTATVTLSAAAVLGQTILSITSFTSAKTFNSAVAITWQVGNGPCFGWRSTADGDTGTPNFPGLVGIVSPAISANTSLVGNGTNLALPVQPGDSMFLNLKVDSTTLVIPIGNIQPLMT